MKAKEILEQIVGDPNICVAVLDGPVDLTHPCFNKAKITQLETLVSDIANEGSSTHHGTHIASLIFGQPASPIRGISPSCRGLIIPVFTNGSDDSLVPCSQIDLARAITLAVERGANVINISGGELVSTGEPHPLLDKAVRFCAENGVLIVASVGNDGCQCLHVPASIFSTLAVGAIDAKGLPLDFSNWGEAYQNNGILALGDKLLGAVPGGGVTTKSGTSFATPIVSGIVALLLSIQIQMGDKPDPYVVREAILQSAFSCLPSEGLDCSRYLRGRLNIEGAYNLVTKRQQAVNGHNNLGQQIQESTIIGRVASFKRLPTLGVQNMEFTTFNPEIATLSTQSPTLDTITAVRNADFIEPNSIDKETNKQKKNQMLEENMTKLVDETCGCPKSHNNHEEMNEHNDQSNNDTEITGSYIYSSDIQASESTMTNQEVATPSVMPAQVHPACCRKQGLVFAIGRLGYDFACEARRDHFLQYMYRDQNNELPEFAKKKDEKVPNPDDPIQMTRYLDNHESDAESLIWTLYIGGSPVYAIRPAGAYADFTYHRLRRYLNEQSNNFVERVSIPGVLSGHTKLLSGQRVPVIIPEYEGMFNWVTKDLVDSVLGKKPSDPAGKKEYETDEGNIINFLERVYYELMNLGQASPERAINYISTQAYMAREVFTDAAHQKLVLDTIEVVRSPVCRPDSDCWDVQLKFFDPNNVLTVARKMYRFTVDVSDVMPVTIGKMQSWSVFLDILKKEHLC